MATSRSKKKSAKKAAPKKATPKKATPKKNTAKKKAAKKKTVSKRSARPSVPLVLDSDERRRLLKPRESFDELIEQSLRVWAELRGFKVPNLTLARLRSLLRKAERAAAREETLRARLEQRLRPLSDARLIAEDAAWRALLDMHATAKLYGRSRPEVMQAFGFLAERLASRPATRSEPVSTE